MDRHIARSGRRPTGPDRAAIALFPSKVRNRGVGGTAGVGAPPGGGTVSISYQWFRSHFKPWVEDLDLGRWVPHQARHTLATSLLRHGATLTHIRRYLGQVSDRMAEPADHHREHHAQAASPPAHRRQPHPRRTAQGRPLHPPLPGPPRRRYRGPHRRPGNSNLILSSRGPWMSVLRAILVPLRRPGAAVRGERHG
ncbi:tyrosine-type recombinase/integrase [Streptomyces sp. NPDC052000]|uniref:tyrosine-type recombinase/integrase n=1 Tax=Streptomyces sp. NPDC052000 TaxID=3155676 RepID=UPI00344B00ED